MTIQYRVLNNGKLQICKDGVYMSFTRDELVEVKKVIDGIVLSKVCGVKYEH